MHAAQAVQVPAEVPVHPALYAPDWHVSHAVHTLFSEYQLFPQPSTVAHTAFSPLTFVSALTSNPIITLCCPDDVVVH